jgi:hypothetical protein
MRAMKRWMLPAAVIAVATLILALLVVRRVHQETTAPPSEAVKLLTLSAMIDGSGRFIFTTNSVVINNRHWNPPTDILFDGEPWTDVKSPPPRWLEIAPGLDLSRAYFVKRRGRDVLALELTEEGFDLYYSDTPVGNSPYVVTIAIPRR